MAWYALHAVNSLAAGSTTVSFSMGCASNSFSSTRPAQVLTKAAKRSKAKMATGAEPECLLDFWAIEVSHAGGGHALGNLRGEGAQHHQPVVLCSPACELHVHQAPRLLSPPINIVFSPAPSPPPPSPQVLRECKECEAAGQPVPFYASDAKMADSVMDFLFASQVSTWPLHHTFFA